MKIRKAEEKDITSLIKLLKEVLAVHAEIRPDIFSSTTKYNEADIKEILKNDKKPIYVAVNDIDKVLGYLFLELKDNKEASNQKFRTTLYIDDICVSKEHRREGIGEALFNFAKELATSLKCDDITLNVWSGNDAALKFYTKHGFKERNAILELNLK